MGEREQIANQLKAELEYQAELGIPDLPQSNQLAKSSSDELKKESLEDIRADIGDCERCKLCSGRTNIVFGVGSPNADIMFIGEGPGQDEDVKGEPFVGRAGQLLTRMIEAMGLKRDDVYIANIVKCRPPNNRNPEPSEIETCYPFLLRQIATVSPKMLIGLGNVAVKALLGTEMGITRLRGQFHQVAGIDMMPTYHPAYLLRNEYKKKDVWEDLQQVMKKLNLPIPKK